MSFTANLAGAFSEDDISISVRPAARHWVFRIEKVFGWVSDLLLIFGYTRESRH